MQANQRTTRPFALREQHLAEMRATREQREQLPREGEGAAAAAIQEVVEQQDAPAQQEAPANQWNYNKVPHGVDPSFPQGDGPRLCSGFGSLGCEC